MRLAITLLAIVLGVLVVASVFFLGEPEPTAPAPETPPTAEAPAEPEADEPVEPAETAEAPATPDASGAPDAAPAEPAVAVEPIPGLQAVPADQRQQATLGSTQDDAPFEMQVTLVPDGAGIASIRLAEYDETATGDEPYLLNRYLIAETPAGKRWRFPFAARSIVVNGTTLPLTGLDWQYVDSDEKSATYRLPIADGEGNEVLWLERTWELAEDSYDLTLNQRVVSRTDRPLRVRFTQNLQRDLPRGGAAYLGDRRGYWAGYFDLDYDPQRVSVYTEGARLMRDDVVETGRVWPLPDVEYETSGLADLVWTAALNRYFTIVAHPLIPAGAEQTADIPALEALFPDVDAEVIKEIGGEADHVVLTATTGDVTILPGNEADLSLSVYAGPRKTEVFDQAPYALMDFDELIRYEMGCTFCTFQGLAKFLLWFLKLIEGQILVIGGVGIGVYDWGVAIIILVLVVRLLLHPLTKKSQTNMQIMGKQMSSLQPEIQKIKKKYENDPAKLNQEMMRLYRERGVNPANMLGCLPMFLQMPIWIALYAMLYYAIELRHVPAFYGVFQAISGGAWPFLGDLSQPDNFIPIFAEPRQINLLFIHPNFQAINILPLLMAVVFFFQQKFMTPPAANEQAAQQQKMMRFMVLLFPILLYSAPSGLTLYILASTGAGVLDSYLVRKHVKELEERGELSPEALAARKQRKPAKPGGLRDRIGKALAEKQKQIEQMQKQQGKGKSGGKR